MNRTYKNIKAFRFIVFLVLFFILFDCAAKCVTSRYISKGFVVLNDFEITQRDHPEEVWDKVFFGNSIVISAYREELSESGYINLGMDYAVVRDLKEMIDKGYIDIGSELVIGCNWLTFYDEFDTNASYIWHRKLFEPYSYFQRDDECQMIKDIFRKLRGNSVEAPYSMQKKIVYHGCLSNDQMKEKTDTYEELYYDLPLEAFSENFEALAEIKDWCDNNNVRLRILFMPWNPSAEKPEIVGLVNERIRDWCAETGTESYDMTDALDPTCFHDICHLNYEYGSYIFMQEVEEWISS